MSHKLPPLPMPPPLKGPTTPVVPQAKPTLNKIEIPHLGAVELKSTNRELSLDESETDKIIAKYLDPKHQRDPNILRFIDNYLYCRDAKQAARITGLNARDGKNLIDRKDIAKTIAKITALAINKFGYDAEEVVEKVKEVAFVDPADVQNEDGSFINNMQDMDPSVRRAIKKMKCKNIFEKDVNGIVTGVTGEIIEIEFWDKMKAVELLAREKGILKATTVVEHGVSKDMRNILLATTKRADARLAAMDEPIEIEGTVADEL